MTSLLFVNCVQVNYSRNLFLSIKFCAFREMSVAAASGISYTKKVLCRYFKFGCCRNGENCSYSHDADSLNAVAPCKFYQRGTCAFGKNCRFDHVRMGSSGTNSSDSGDGASSSGSSSVGVPVALKKSWAEAPEFVPAMTNNNMAVPGRSYAQAAGARSSTPGGSLFGGDDREMIAEELCPFAIAGECRYGSACAYVHGHICDLCGDPCLHPYNEVQRKEHRKDCLQRHEEDMKHSFELARSVDKQCGICYDMILEKPGKKGDQRFGILPSCNHVFCLICIRTWRAQKENVSTKSARACPQCRVPSDFVIPSKMWVEDKDEKEELMKAYKANMHRKACKFFNYGEGECAFGNKCFYRHETRDGKKVDVGPPKRKLRTRMNADGEVDILQHMLMWDFIDSADMHDSFMLEMEFMDSDTDDTEDDWEDWENDSVYDTELGSNSMSYFGGTTWDGDTDSVCDDGEFDHPPKGGPFSAILPSMWPQNLKSFLGSGDENEVRYDEFGFRVEEEDGPEQSSNPLLSTPFVEDPQHRLQWLAYLEFDHGKNSFSDVAGLSWEGVDSKLSQTDKLKSMIQAGIPHSLRAQVWLRISGALLKKESSDSSYVEIVKASSGDQLAYAKQIEKDLLRTLPTNVCFSQPTAPGIAKLRRVLRAIAWLYPQIGYCQGMGVIVASLLLFMEEDDSFWMVAAIIEDLLPASYYSTTLLGVQADQRVLRELVQSQLPDFDKVLIEHDIELSLVTLHWFVTLFASVVHMRVLLRIWDLLFYDGSIVIFRAAMAMLKLEAPRMLDTENAADIFNVLSDIPGNMKDISVLMNAFMDASSQLSEVVISTQRRLHLAYLIAAEESMESLLPRSVAYGEECQGKGVDAKKVSALASHDQVYRRSVKRSRSLLQAVVFGADDEADAAKLKNVRQTELLVDMREAIVVIGRHFQESDPRYADVSLSADYSMSSHGLDHEIFARVCTNKHRRAKAMLDFERRDDDELGFRRNDLITVVSMKDEHCWIGELNGLRGWFPAKFVELLDERSKQYSSAGDDTVQPIITDLVRGTLCPTIKAVLEHGLKRPSLLGTACHPWQFVEEVANHEVEKDFGSVYSRLVLCRTFRLDEDGKVLTPEELLFRCVAAVNRSHDEFHTQMDVKLRSLVCMGLNEQVLHLWLEVLASCAPVVEKWYNPWSFMASPGWVQIKCELRLLSSFPFSLNPNWELPAEAQPAQPLKDGVRDMLVKHHLFSWDL